MAQRASGARSPRCFDQAGVTPPRKRQALRGHDHARARIGKKLL
jgi:hypothetical protein